MTRLASSVAPWVVDLCSADTDGRGVSPVACELNEVYDDCKIRCDQLCHYFDGFLEAQGFCQVSHLDKAARACPIADVLRRRKNVVASRHQPLLVTLSTESDEL